MLDVLGEAGAHATFFVVGAHARAHPALVERILAEGHGLGSHSDTHPAPRTASMRDLVTDFTAGRRTLEAIAGAPVTLFRPPGGFHDLPTVLAARRAGLRSWVWTRAGDDWLPDITGADVLTALGAPGGGDVVLLHDRLADASGSRADRGPTIAALPPLLAAADEARITWRVLPGATTA